MREGRSNTDEKSRRNCYIKNFCHMPETLGKKFYSLDHMRNINESNKSDRLAMDEPNREIY